MCASPYSHRQSLLPVALILAGCAAVPPANPRGANGGALEPCPSAPHCVSSTAASTDKHVPPLHIEGSQDAIRARIVAAVRSMPRTHIKIAKDDYVHATYSSRLLGFVDDVEFVIHQGGKVDIRSASRSGYYDFGVNRRRVAAIRKRLRTQRQTAD